MEEDTAAREGASGGGGDETSDAGAKGKRTMKKDDSGISVERSEEASSEEDEVSKRLRMEGLAKGQGEPRQSCSTEKDLAFNKPTGRAKERNYRKGNSQRGKDEEEDEGGSTEEELASMQKHASSKGKHKAKVSEESIRSPDSGNPDMEMEVADDPEEKEAKGDDPTKTYRKRSHESESDSAPEVVEPEVEEEEEEEMPPERRRKGPGRSRQRGRQIVKFESEEDDEDEPEAQPPRVLLKARPRHKWFVVQEVIGRQRGSSTRLQSGDLFRSRCYGSLHCVQRLELMYKMESHKGCINALNFNPSGTLLASGSDDLRVVVWDWSLGRAAFSYDSGHRSNVFQAKFLPLQGDTHIASCARDGQVRLAELSSAGGCRSTRRLAQHKGPAHRLAMLPDSPHVFLSAAEDGHVFLLDVRMPKHEKLLVVKEKDHKVALYSINANPLDTNEFCVSGRDQYVRIYDRRRASSEGTVKKFCPHHLHNSSIFTNVTCAVYNYNGTEVLGTYNDEDIYLFDARHSDGADYMHKYEGHRNNATVKGVNFFGPESQFVVSGSDCGNIFFWDKESEAIVQWMPGDENGVVNCLEPHPKMPVLATSGLDDDVKIWVPSCENDPKLVALKGALEQTVIGNQKGREDDRTRDPETFDGQMLWILWRHIRRTERRRRQAASQVGGDWEDNNSSSSEDDSDSDESDEASNRVQCPPS